MARPMLYVKRSNNQQKKQRRDRRQQMKKISKSKVGTKCRGKTLVLIILGTMLTTGYAYCASIPDILWSGELQSGDVINDQLKSSDVWKIAGSSGERVVIVLAVKEKQILPEMFLFRPGVSECEAHALLHKGLMDGILNLKGDFTSSVQDLNLFFNILQVLNKVLFFFLFQRNRFLHL